MANKKDLTYDEAAQVMNEMMSGETTQVQIAAFLTALAMKGETIEEITGCAAEYSCTPENAGDTQRCNSKGCHSRSGIRVFG